jgi:hypothetical protein
MCYFVNFGYHVGIILFLPLIPYPSSCWHNICCFKFHRCCMWDMSAFYILSLRKDLLMQQMVLCIYIIQNDNVPTEWQLLYLKFCSLIRDGVIIIKKCLVDRRWRSCFSTIQSLVHAISSVVDILLCHFVKLSGIFSRCLPLSFLPLILPVVTTFSKFPFLKMCLMSWC